MKTDCGNTHKPDYSRACCIKFLIEMSELSQNSTLYHKFSKLLLLTLNHADKNNSLNFDGFKLDILNSFLDVLTKNMSHFYFLKKYEYAKKIVKIGLRACRETPYKDHPDIVYKANTIYVNLACIYERMGFIQKSLMYLKSTLRLWSSSIDKAILYNNLARIYLTLNDSSAALKANKLCLELISVESNNILRHRLQNTNFNLITENKNKIELISYLFYNNGFLLEKTKIEDESYLVYRKGYEFSLSTLGELSILTNKFKPKLSYIKKISKPIQNFSDYRRKTLDSKYDSDIDYNSIIDGNFGGFPNYLPKMKPVKKANSNNKNVGPLTANKRKRENSIDSMMNQTFIQRGESIKNFMKQETYDVKDLKNKMDYLIRKFEKIENMRASDENLKKKIPTSKDSMPKSPFDNINDENLNKTIEKAESLNNTLNNTLITQVDELNKKVNLIKEQNDTNIFSIKNIAKTLKPTIKKIIDNLDHSRAKLMRGRTNQSSRSPNDSSFVKEKYINDLINEFEEVRSRSGSKNSSVSVSKRNSSIVNTNTKNNQTDNSNLNNKTGQKISNNDIPNLSNKNISSSSKINSNNSSMNIQKSTNTIAATAAAEQKPKRTLKQMFSKAFNFATGKKDISKSRLAKMLQDEDEHPTDNAAVNNNNSENNVKNDSNNINEIMTKIDNDKLNTSEISIKNAKLNNSSFIDLNDDEDEGQKRKLDFKEGVKKEMKKFVFNVIKDNTTDEYEFKTFYIKNENANTNKNDYKENSNNDKKNDKENNDLNGAGGAAVNPNKETKPKTQNSMKKKKDNLNDSRSSKNDSLSKANRFVSIFKEGMKKDLIKFDIKIELDEEPADYQFKPFYIKNENYSSDSNKNSKENIANNQSSHKKYTESISKLLLNAKDNSNNESKYDLTFKKKNEFTAKSLIESLIAKYKFTSRNFSILREMDNKFYKINICYTKPSEEKKGIVLRLYEEGNGLTVMAENVISFSKLKGLVEKLCLFYAIPRIIDINLIDTLDLFLEKVFIYYCYLIKKEGKISLGILPRPVGICSNKSYQFSFLKTQCIIDILIMHKRETKFFIYNSQNDNISFCFDWILDHSSFSCLFGEMAHTNFEKIDNEVIIKSYRLKDERYLSKNNLIPTVILKIQEIFKIKVEKADSKIDVIYNHFKNAVIKMNLKNNLSFIDLFMNNTIERANLEKKNPNELEKSNEDEKNLNNISHLAFDYYILKKDSTMNYYSKSFNLDDKYIQHILGTNYKFLNSYLLLSQQVPINYIVLNALILEKNTSSIKEDYDLFIRQPITLMNYKLQLELKKSNFTVDFSFIFYSKLCNFYKINCIESSTNKSFCIIFPGFELYNLKISQTDFEKYTDEEIQKLILDNLPITNDFFLDEEKRELFLEILTNYLQTIIKGEKPYSIFDNIFDVFKIVLKD